MTVPNTPDYADQRYYNNWYGRFTTADPAGLGATDLRNSSSWNMYAYSNDDPVNGYDPFGLFQCNPDTLCAPPNPGPDPAMSEFCWMAIGMGAIDFFNMYCGSGGGGAVGPGDPVAATRAQRLNNDLQASRANFDRVKDAIRGAMPSNSSISASIIECMGGIESRWNPSDTSNGRAGMFQYNQQSWMEDQRLAGVPRDQRIPWSTANTMNIADAVAVTLDGLMWRLRVEKGDLLKAISDWNGEFNRYGQTGYGQAVIDCAGFIDLDFTTAFTHIWNLQNP